MALEPITRQEKIIAGKDLEPITRMEKFLKQYGGGGGSVPKPLTYDYMPEGYPSKSVQTTTLMDGQEVAFVLDEDIYFAYPTEAFEIVEGQTYAVNWDGTEYECVGLDFDENVSVIGNLFIKGIGDDAGEPFVYSYYKSDASCQFATLDTSATHTISVKTAGEIFTPMAAEFLPAAALITHASHNSPYIYDLTYAELHARLLGGKPVVLYEVGNNEYLYLTKWQRKPNGDIYLAFAGDQNYGLKLSIDGTIGRIN